MLSAFARAAMVLGRRDFLDTARRSAAFLLQAMRDERGRLYRTRRAGRAHLLGFLEDHAAVALGLLDLYEADPNPRWLRGALELQERIEEHFTAGGAYCSTSDEHEKLLVRPASAQESSLPSDVGLAATSAFRLGLLAGRTEWIAHARRELELRGGLLRRAPNAFGQLLVLADLIDARPKEIYVAGRPKDPAVQAFLERARKLWPPYRVLALVPAGEEGVLAKLLPAAAGKRPLDGRAACYVCTEGVCKEPLTDPAAPFGR